MSKLCVYLLIFAFLKSWKMEIYMVGVYQKGEHHLLNHLNEKNSYNYSVRRRRNTGFPFLRKNDYEIIKNNHNIGFYEKNGQSGGIKQREHFRYQFDKDKIASLLVKLGKKKKKKKKKNFFIGHNLASSISKNMHGQVKRDKRNFLFNEDENEKMEPLDPELHESLSGCIENDIKDNYFDSMIDCSEDDYNSDDIKFDKDDLSEETKRKKYYAYGRRFTDKDFQSEHVHKYYQHLPIYYDDNDDNNNGSFTKFKRVYKANKIENLERNIREEDLQYPSVPVNWKVYVCLFFDKKYNYENEEDKKIYDMFNKNIRHKYVLEFLSWVKLSTRIYQNTSKILMLFNLKRNDNIFGNLLFFTSVNLHYADMFMKSNPYVKLGLCEELYLYAYESNNDHFLIGVFPNLFLQKNYLFIKFFNKHKLNDINGLYEKHMRFYVRSNMIFKLGVLKKASKDSLKDFFLTTNQYLPITEDQTKSILSKFDKEMRMFDRCSDVEVGSDCEIRKVHYGEENIDEGTSNEEQDVNNVEESTATSDDAHDIETDKYFEKYNDKCLAELNIANCKDEEEAREFLEKDPYMRCCFYDSIFFCEVREVVPHAKYSDGYVPKMKSNLDYKYELDSNLNPNYSLEDKPEYMGNKSLSEKKLENYEKVNFDILDTFIKLKYTNQEVEYEEWDRQNDIRDVMMTPSKEEFKPENLAETNSKCGGNGVTVAELNTTTPRSILLKHKENRKKNMKKYKIKIVDYNNDYIEYICNVQRNKIAYIKAEEKRNEINKGISSWSHDIYDVLNEDMRDPNIHKKKNVILIDNTLQFFDHIFFKDYLSNFVYISLPPGEFIEEPYAIKDEKNYDFTIFNNSLATQDDFLKRQNYQPRFLKGIWLKKEHSKILFYDKQNNALMFGTGIDKTFSWNKKVDNHIMKRALINMEIALEKLRQGSCVTTDDITVNQPTERTIKEYTDEYTSFERRFTSPHNQLPTSAGYPDYKPPPGLEYLNPHIWEKTPDEHKELMLDTEKVQKIHSNFLKKLELYKVSINDDPFTQKVPSENDILSNNDKVDIEYL
ncbi:hypothetical protein, conserved [Plasmodium gonderi]|uniref:Uncharacterized protein n=1 Tax=Plasmodium gonderi TaxID=77519 RepID=A0A1Y1JTB4_PLAGO|nr:hypothetical protein, conserved [Plasmodium gonderi]GAW83663.1 hypothetical protein, conserved [Plasmodium gonderi]